MTGELNSFLFVVVEGAVDVLLPGVDTPHVRLGAGECVGELSLIDGHPVSADVVAAEATTLLQLDQTQVWDAHRVERDLRAQPAARAGRARCATTTPCWPSRATSAAASSACRWSTA